MTKLIRISDLSTKLNLTDGKKPLNYILRYWEKQFNQIRPKVINKQRYYSEDQVEIIKLVKFLLRDKGMTIKGAKNVLNSGINKLDDYKNNSLKAEYYKSSIKEKTKKILDKINKLKHGKKNSHKS